MTPYFSSVDFIRCEGVASEDPTLEKSKFEGFRLNFRSLNIDAMSGARLIGTSPLRFFLECFTAGVDG